MPVSALQTEHWNSGVEAAAFGDRLKRLRESIGLFRNLTERFGNIHEKLKTPEGVKDLLDSGMTMALWLVSLTPSVADDAVIGYGKRILENPAVKDAIANAISKFFAGGIPEGTVEIPGGKQTGTVTILSTDELEEAVSAAGLDLGAVMQFVQFIVNLLLTLLGASAPAPAPAEE